jgi:3-oxoacyl-[acyl-carrier protein] reductase
MRSSPCKVNISLLAAGAACKQALRSCAPLLNSSPIKTSPAQLRKKNQKGPTLARRTAKATQRIHELRKPASLRIVICMPEPGITMSLEDRIAIVTGGSRGIGAAIVRIFARAGARILFNYHKSSDEADRLVRECGGTNRCVAVQQDLATAEAARNLVDAAVAQFGKVDVVVGNHGVWPPQDVPVDQMGIEQWRTTLAINLDSIFGLVKYAVAQMKKQKQGGHIVLVSSTAGQRGEAFHCDYAASKGAIISMVKGLSTELAPHRVLVNCVAPGWVETDMAAPALNNPDISPRVYAAIPLGRAGKPEEIAATVLFLCTPHAGFITGEVVNVNGGAVLVG